MQRKWLMAAAAVFAVGVAAGSMAAVRTAPETLYTYFSSLGSGEITARTGTAVLDALILWAVLFFSAFFRFGAVTAATAVGMKGFCDGYAIAAILRILGIKGLELCFFDVLNAPIAIVMAALAVGALAGSKRTWSGYLAACGLLLLLSAGCAALGAVSAGALSGRILGNMEF